MDELFVTEDVVVIDDVGRAEDMVITSGFNVSPVDVESVLLQQPGVAEAADRQRSRYAVGGQNSSRCATRWLGQRASSSTRTVVLVWPRFVVHRDRGGRGSRWRSSAVDAAAWLGRGWAHAQNWLGRMQV